MRNKLGARNGTQDVFSSVKIKNKNSQITLTNKFFGAKNFKKPMLLLLNSVLPSATVYEVGKWAKPL